MRSYGETPLEYRKVVSGGLLPAVEVDGRLATESLDIMFLLESMFVDAERPMLPPSGNLYRRAQALLELERAVFRAWYCFVFQPQVPFVSGAREDFISAMRQVNDELTWQQNSPWFFSYEHPTIVDMQYVSHFERIVSSVLYWKGYDVRGEHLAIDAWLTSFEERPAYTATKGDFYTHVMSIPPQYGRPSPDDNENTRYVQARLEPANASWPPVWGGDDFQPWSILDKAAPFD